METFCACAWPCAVNKSEERYHCDRCGYPLGPQDRRQAILKLVGQQVWGMLVYEVQCHRRSELAWDSVDHRLDPLLAPRHQIQPATWVPPPIRGIRLFSSRHWFVRFDPER